MQRLRRKELFMHRHRFCPPQRGAAQTFLYLLAGLCLTAGCFAKAQVAQGSSRTPSAPGIATTSARNGAVIVHLQPPAPGMRLYYTLDGAAPSARSVQYFAPFLVASHVTLRVVALAPDGHPGTIATRILGRNLPSGTLVWSDEFSGSGSSMAQPDPAIWTYDVGLNCCGNHEQETYCSWNSKASPCTPASPNAYVGDDGLLHIIARSPSPGVYTSARLKTQGLFSFQYGRVEARIKLPESHAMWPAFWLLGSNIVTRSWPACGEADIMEHIDGAHPPLSAGKPPQPYDWVQSSVHGTGLDGGHPYHASGFSAADWHTYEMIWSPGKVQYYIDSPENIYETFTPANTKGTWPFDQGPMFLLLNLAVGGSWPGNVNRSTIFPGRMLVDYVRIYTN